MNLKTALGQLRMLAILEGISYLMLGITMVMKYNYEMLMPNKIVGMAHGVLFIAYCFWVIWVAREEKWPFKVTFVALFASLLPFATFFIESRILKPLALAKENAVK